MKTTRKPKDPPLFKLIKVGLAIVSRMSPSLAGLIAHKFWIQTFRNNEPARETRFLQKTKWETLELDKGVIQVYTIGNGPTVILLHGWNGRGAQLGQIATALSQRGYKVVLFDAPGHGRSLGRTSSVLKFSQSLQLLTDQYTPVHAVITHSLGGLALLNALSNGMNINKAVCIAPPKDVSSLTSAFAKATGLGEKVERHHRKRIEQQFGKDVWHDFSMPVLAKNITANGLIIHDRNDRFTRFEDSQATAALWPSCEFIETDKLGHMRILRSEDVIQGICDFISA